MWEIGVSTVPAAITENAIEMLINDLNSKINSGTHISTTIVAPGQLSIIFTNKLSDDDITILNNSINTRLTSPPSYSFTKSYSTGKLIIKNSSYTILDKIIFQGNSPLKFNFNSYANDVVNYHIRFVNSNTREILGEASFNNINTYDILSTNSYIGSAVTSETPILIEIQGKIDSVSKKAYVESILIDHN